MTTRRADILPVAPIVAAERMGFVTLRLRRGLNREEAAEYVGIGVTMFDELVGEGTLPQPIHLRSRKVWDIKVLDLALDRLSAQPMGGNPWDRP
jgi:hypothetical protein